jgi:VWFA-related protein
MRKTQPARRSSLFSLANMMRWDASAEARRFRPSFPSPRAIMLSTGLSAALLCLLGPSVLHAQSAPSSDQAAPALRVTTHIVQVHVIVQSKKGEPVTGLTKEDFTLLDQGQPQKIAFFSEESGGLRSAPAEPVPPNTFSNRYEQTGQMPGSVTVILLDALNTPHTVQTYMRYSAVKVLRQLNPQDHVAIYVLGATRLRIIQDFTQDSAALLRALNADKGEYSLAVDTLAGDNALTGGDPFTDEWDAAAPANGWNGAWAHSLIPARAQFTSQAIAAIANHLASVPGRKSLVWISSNFPVSMGLTRVLNQSDIAVYPMDPGGMRNAPAFAVTTGQTSQLGGHSMGGENGSPMNTSTLAPSLDSTTMNELADRTGGRASYNNNDIAGSVRRAIDDGRISYVLAYYPDHGKWDGQFREIKVTVDRPDVEARSRKGYFAVADGSAGQKELHAAMEEALASPLESTGLGFTVSVQPGPQQGQAIFSMNLDATKIHWDDDAGRWRGGLRMVFRQYDATGNPTNSVEVPLTLNLEKATYDRVMDKGINLVRHMTIAPQTETVKVLVLDTASGAMGTVSVPVKNYAQVVPQGTSAPPSAPAATKHP